MALEGMLGKFGVDGERAATDDHPAVLRHLPLTDDAAKKELPIGTVLKQTDGAFTYEPLLSTDTDAIIIGVVDDARNLETDSTKTAQTLIHGGVKARLLKTGDGKELTDAQIAALFAAGIYPI